MDDQNATLRQAYPHLSQGDLDLFNAETKKRLLEQIELASEAPPPKIEAPKTAPMVQSLLLAHRVAGNTSILSARGSLLPGDPIELADIGGGVEAWRSLVARGLIALHPDLADPGKSDATEIDSTGGDDDDE